MAGKSSQEKTEQATPRKLRKAREQGEVAQSRELTTAMLLVLTLILMAYQLGSVGNRFQDLSRHVITTANGQLDNQVLLTTLSDALREAAMLIAPVLMGIAVLGLVIPYLQVGPVLSGEPLKPKLDRLNPVEGLRNVFFKLDAYMNLIKASLKVIVVVAIVWYIMRDNLREVLMLSERSPKQIGDTGGDLISGMLIRVCLFLFSLGVLDFFYQRWKFGRDQMMTKEDVKREHKDQDGDPTHKAERQRLHEEYATNAMLTDVRDADVVLVNPTHYACALRYDPDQEGSPRLIAKGQGHLAARIREIAKEEDIPIVRDVPLARTLYEMQLNTQIPEALYDAVAEVLRWVETVARSQGTVPAWVEHEQAKAAEQAEGTDTVGDQASD